MCPIYSRCLLQAYTHLPQFKMISSCSSRAFRVNIGLMPVIAALFPCHHSVFNTLAQVLRYPSLRFISPPQHLSTCSSSTSTVLVSEEQVSAKKASQIEVHFQNLYNPNCTTHIYHIKQLKITQPVIQNSSFNALETVCLTLSYKCSKLYKSVLSDCYYSFL